MITQKSQEGKGVKMDTMQLNTTMLVNKRFHLYMYKGDYVMTYLIYADDYEMAMSLAKQYCEGKCYAFLVELDERN